MRNNNHQRIIFLLQFFLCVQFTALAQPCTNPGQTPETAFPVCGATVFVQGFVPNCQAQPAAYSCGVTFNNPYYYKFTVYSSGTLGFLITPFSPVEDYDFALFNVTNVASPNEIFTNSNLIKTGNIYLLGGTTGCAAGGLVNQCGGAGLLNDLQNVVAGEKYLLQVVNYGGTGNGYTLSFTGGTASITNAQPINFVQAAANCANTSVTVKLNQPIKCTSLAANGSDFSISPAVAITSATSPDCAAGQFSTDSIVLHFSGTIAPGPYTLSIQTGTDGNTLLGICDNPMAIPQTVNFMVAPPATPPVFAQVYTPVCAPDKIKFKLSKPVLCDSVAADGSDFSITGPANVTITGVNTFCSGNPAVTTDLELLLSAPITTSGLYTITAKKGSDNNTAVDLCGLSQPVGNIISTNILGSVNANFTYTIHYGCLQDTVYFNHPGNGVADWVWNFDDPASGALNTSTQQNPVHIYSNFGLKNIALAVSNGACNSNSTQQVNLDNAISADFTIAPGDSVCLNSGATFATTSTGINLTYAWDFGNGQLSNVPNPPVVNYASPGKYTVTHRIINNYACSASVQKNITILPLPDVSYTVNKNNVCIGQQLLFAANAVGNLQRYVWDFGDGVKETATLKPAHTYLQPGNYISSLTVNDLFCGSHIKSIPITIFEIPVVELGNDTTLCMGNTISLTAGNNPLYTYLWNTGATTSSIVYGNNSNRIDVTVTNGACVTKDAINIKVLLSCKIFVPNAFTPNGDGKNDLFKILNADLVKDFRLQIFNQLGQKVFQSNDPLSGWDGTLHGANANQGVYTWVVRFKENSNSTASLLKGTVLLIR
jgi:gliding motility-associated-like protein